MTCHGKKDKKQIPELQKANEIEAIKRCKEWCLENNIDYDKTIESFYKRFGPQYQERDTPITGDEDTDKYFIYLEKKSEE